MIYLPTSGQIAKYFGECKQIASRSDVEVETVMGQGDAASQIVGYAHDGDIDT